VITTLMATCVALHWKHNPWIVYPLNGAFLALDLVFFASTSTKLFDGGWFPLLIAGVIAFLMLTWRTGERIMDLVRLEVRQRAKDFLAQLKLSPPQRLPGTSVVLGRMAKGIPLALTQNLKHNCCLHTQVLLVAVNVAETPRVSDEHRGVVASLGDGVTRVALNFGFMEQPDVPAGLRCLMEHQKIDEYDLAKITYFTGHETIISAGRRSGMARWRERVYAYMHHNAQQPGAYFRIPSAQIMEIGIEFEI
jgi:KUP system potassium uptake protein